MATLTDAPYRFALALIDHHGYQAAIHAAMEADAMLDIDDLDGPSGWGRNLEAVRLLQDRKVD